jgi:glc operon protein GlcG
MKIGKLSLLAAAAVFLLTSAGFSSTAFAQQKSRIEAGVSNLGLALGETHALNVKAAKQLVAAAIKSSCSLPVGTCTGVFCVADGAGTIIYLEAIDGVLMGGPGLCIAKAQASAFWRRPTANFQEAVNNKRNTSYADGTFPHMTTSPGGVPIFKDGRCVGGVGIAAVGLASKQIDAAIVQEATRLFGSQKPTFAGQVMRH